MTRPRVVIIGGGFGGLYAARVLGKADVDVVVIDRTNHHVFQPLLYQVATATLAPTDICAPIRWLLRDQRNVDVVLTEVKSIDPRQQIVHCDGGRQLEYDFLIVAAGARHSYFGHPEWETFAPGLKSVEDAIELRRRWLLAFERADQATDDAERAAELTFVIIGGGPTGVELAGMLPTISRYALPSDFRHIDTASARIVLIEGGPRILPAIPEDLSARARQRSDGARRRGAARGSSSPTSATASSRPKASASRRERSSGPPGTPRRRSAHRLASDRSHGPRAGRGRSQRARPPRRSSSSATSRCFTARASRCRRCAGGDSERRSRGPQHHSHHPARGTGALPLS